MPGFFIVSGYEKGVRNMSEPKEKVRVMPREKDDLTAVGKKRINVRYMTATAMLSALSFVLFFIQFSTPLTPEFLKMDISELPALIGSFSMGPVYGVLICLIKNLLHLTITSTGGVGELSNFLLGVAFVLPAGLIYGRHKTKKNANFKCQITFKPLYYMTLTICKIYIINL